MKLKNRLNLVMIVIIGFLSVVILTSCPNLAGSYVVYYIANGATSGQVPYTVREYPEWAMVTVEENSGNLAKTGFVFAGWNTSKNGTGTDYAPGQTFTITDDVTLYAKWIASATHSVSYDGNGATFGTPPADTIAYLAGETVSVSGNSGNLSRTDYWFNGWNTEEDGSGTSYSPGDDFAMGDEDVTLYAEWRVPFYTVSYDGNGHSGGTVPVDSTEYAVLQSVTVLGTGDMVRHGYTFVAWNTASNGSGDSFLSGEITNIGYDNLTLFAQWSALPTYRAYYVANGATNGTEGAVPIDNVGYLEGETAEILGNESNLHKAGSSFVSWNTDSNGGGTTYLPGQSHTFDVTADLTLYAQWSELVKIVAFDGTIEDNFGNAVAISGDYVVSGTGKINLGEFLPDAGAIYVFRQTAPGVFDTGAKLTAPDAEEYDAFGNSVAISGDFVIAGASVEDEIDTSSGAAYIFHRTGTAEPNEWNAGIKLTAFDGEEEDLFGFSVGISGVYAIVGAHKEDEAGVNAGAAYIFRCTDVENNVWGTDEADVAKLTAIDSAVGDFFGWSVAISGDIAVVGAYRETSTAEPEYGAVYVFERTGSNTWDSGTKLVAPDGEANDYFGYSVSIDGDFIVVGAWGDDRALGPYMYHSAGAAYVFERNGPGDWAFAAKLVPFHNLYDNIIFGWEVGIAGDVIIVSAHQANVQDGAVYLYRRSDAGVWSPYTCSYPPEGVEDGYFGRSVAISTSYAVAGTTRDDTPAQNSGSVFLLALE